MDITEFEKRIGITFSDKNLLRQAFVHRSYINENRGFSLPNNERLEFLGDAVLELIITDFLFHQYPDKDEGVLTSYRAAIVNAHSLAKVSANLGVNDFILLSKGESKDNGRARNFILADAFEAITGAIFEDQGYEAAEIFIGNNVFPMLADIIKKDRVVDAKSRFQELAQENVGITPSYKTLKEEGPDHDKRFTVGLFLGDILIVEGKGKSKQEAEQEAAEKAIGLKDDWK